MYITHYSNILLILQGARKKTINLHRIISLSSNLRLISRKLGAIDLTYYTPVVEMY